MSIDPHAASDRLVVEARDVAVRLTFEERAAFLRALARSIYDGVKLDPLVGGPAPAGVDELDGIGTITNAAEAHFYAAVDAQLRADGRK